MYILFRAVLLFIISCLSLAAWAEDEEPGPPKAIYYTIEEPFTINFMNQSEQRVRYLQIKVALMAHNQTTIDNASNNLPMLQDALRTLFAEQTYDSVDSTEARRQLQANTLRLANTILQQELGSDPLDEVYFTSFVLQ